MLSIPENEQRNYGFLSNFNLRGCQKSIRRVHWHILRKWKSCLKKKLSLRFLISDIMRKKYGFISVKKISKLLKTILCGLEENFQGTFTYHKSSKKLLYDWRRLKLTEKFKIEITRHPATTRFLFAATFCWRSFLEKWKHMFQKEISVVFFYFGLQKVCVFRKILRKLEKRFSWFSESERELFGLSSNFFQLVVKTTLCEFEETYEGICFSLNNLSYISFRKRARNFSLFAKFLWRVVQTASQMSEETFRGKMQFFDLYILSNHFRTLSQKMAFSSEEVRQIPLSCLLHVRRLILGKK